MSKQRLVRHTQLLRAHSSAHSGDEQKCNDRPDVGASRSVTRLQRQKGRDAFTQSDDAQRRQMHTSIAYASQGASPAENFYSPRTEKL